MRFLQGTRAGQVVEWAALLLLLLVVAGLMLASCGR